MPYQLRQKQKKLAKEKLHWPSDRPGLLISGKKQSLEATVHLVEIIKGLNQLNIAVFLLPDLEIVKDLPFDFVKNCPATYQAADMMLFLSSESTVWPDMQKALDYQIVPIGYHFKNNPGILLQDYNPRTQRGNAFLYEHINVWEIFAAVVRAIENYKFPYDWENIVREGGRFAE